MPSPKGIAPGVLSSFLASVLPPLEGFRDFCDDAVPGKHVVADIQRLSFELLEARITFSGAKAASSTTLSLPLNALIQRSVSLGNAIQPALFEIDVQPSYTTIYGGLLDDLMWTYADTT